MTLADTTRAIGAVSKLLKEYLHSRTNLEISCGRPQPAGQQAGNRLNLFLYEAQFDPNMKNVSLLPDRPAPLWLSLRYLITPFDSEKESDTAEAHEHLGKGLRALQELSYLQITGSVDPDVPPALKDNPEELKITFEEISADLLSKLMQGTDEKYRFSMAFQIRPVLISPPEPPDTRYRVGIDYSVVPEAVLPNEGLDGVRVAALAGLRPEIDRLSAEPFDAVSALAVMGRRFDPRQDEVTLDGHVLNVARVESSGTRIAFALPAALADGGISAGGKILRVQRPLPFNHYRASNPIFARLRPLLSSVAQAGASVQLTGVLLGKETDDIVVAFCQGETVVKYYEQGFAYASNQKTLTLTFASGQQPGAGTYQVMLQVNGVMAAERREVTL